jgi:transketolase
MQGGNVLSAIDLAVKTIKGLAIDAVEKANSGHPGMPMGMADATTVLWSQYLKFDPDNPDWDDRDRFVLSAGHGSMLLYSLLHLSGYPDMPLSQLKAFRQWDSKTAGHPEYGFAGGIETTTGPLGQGLGNAVGMALAEHMLGERLNSNAASLVDHFTYVIASDGDLMEGVASEAASLAGHWNLGKLIVLYDDNSITIDGGTELSFTESVGARFEAYGWHCVTVDGHNHDQVSAAIEAGQAETNRPTLIQCRTHIGHGAPTKQDSSSSHGAPLGAEEIRGTKENMGWPTDETFTIPDEVPAFFRAAADRGRTERRHWLNRLAEVDADTKKRYNAQMARCPDASVFDSLPEFESGTKLATRKASQAALNAICDNSPQLIGGSADLAGSNGTTLKGYDAIGAEGFGDNNRNIHFGVREHGMAAVMNGLSLHGGFRPYGGTFLIFSDYMRPSMRLAALMHQPVVYVFTHDSVFLGEDGPTHQPVEHAMSLRLIPNLDVMRPADANETAAAWQCALQRTDGPTALLLTRQGLPVLDSANRAGVARGGYIVRKEQSANGPSAILMATGSEVHLALDAAEQLGPDVRVVSIPSFDRFDDQDAAYQESVLPSSVKARYAIEAGRSFGWERYVGDRGRCWGIDRFGASAPAGRIAQEFGFTADAFANVVKTYLNELG